MPGNREEQSQGGPSRTMPTASPAPADIAAPLYTVNVASSCEALRWDVCAEQVQTDLIEFRTERGTLIEKVNDYKVSVQNMEETCKRREVTVFALTECGKELENENEELWTESPSIPKVNDEVVTKRMAASPTTKAEIGKTSLFRPYPAYTMGLVQT